MKREENQSQTMYMEMTFRIKELRICSKLSSIESYEDCA